MKTCNNCLETKPLTDFNNHKKYKFGKHYLCKECKRKSDKEYRFSTDKNGINANRRLNMKRRYGISTDGYVELHKAQRGICPITGKTGDLVVDHNKHTGAIRGLIDNHINRGLGLFDHNPKWLRAAADYLERKESPRHA